jgi:hypothetical protein
VAPRERAGKTLTMRRFSLERSLDAAAAGGLCCAGTGWSLSSAGYGVEFEGPLLAFLLAWGALCGTAFGQADAERSRLIVGGALLGIGAAILQLSLDPSITLAMACTFLVPPLAGWIVSKGGLDNWLDMQAIMTRRVILLTEEDRRMKIVNGKHRDPDELIERECAIEQLALHPLSHDALASLLALVDRAPPGPYDLGDDKKLAERAVLTLGTIRDPRASKALAARLGGHCHEKIVAALGNSRHEVAIPDIVGAARKELANRRCAWLEPLLRQMGTNAATNALRDFQCESVPWIVKAAREALNLDGQTSWLGNSVLDNPGWIEKDLTAVGTEQARKALQGLRSEMVPLLRPILLESTSFEDVARARNILQSFDTPSARVALEAFSAAPSRKLIRKEHREDWPSDRQAPIEWTVDIECYSSVLGQKVSAEERHAAQEEKRRLEEKKLSHQWQGVSARDERQAKSWEKLKRQKAAALERKKNKSRRDDDLGR